MSEKLIFKIAFEVYIEAERIEQLSRCAMINKISA
jgi:hypothetical protein